MKKRGFTLIEVLIVVTIVALLAVMAIFLLLNNLGKSRDGRRKADLDRIKIAFEEYYVDENTYPPSDILVDCNSGALKPYLGSVPCDPKTKRPYCYLYDADFNGQNYRLLSSLESSGDPIIADLGCSDSDEYCGYEAECVAYGSRFNYGVSSSNVVVASENIGSGQIGASPSPSPSPSLDPLPSTNPGNYACTPFGNCDDYTGNPIFPQCPINFSEGGDDSQCFNYCLTSPQSARCPGQ